MRDAGVDVRMGSVEGHTYNATSIRKCGRRVYGGLPAPLFFENPSALCR
jgi:hypothetical protein